MDAYRSGSEELDDRGVIYVRHGEPAERLKPFVFGLMPSETWRYAPSGRRSSVPLHRRLRPKRRRRSLRLSARGERARPARRVRRAGRPAPALARSRSRHSTAACSTGVPTAPRAPWPRAGHRPGEHRVSARRRTVMSSSSPAGSSASANLVAVGHRPGRTCSRTSSSPWHLPTVRSPCAQVAGIPCACACGIRRRPGKRWSGRTRPSSSRLDRTLEPAEYLIGRVELPLPAGPLGVAGGGPDRGTMPASCCRETPCWGARRACARAQRSGDRRAGRPAPLAGHACGHGLSHAVRDGAREPELELYYEVSARCRRAQPTARDRGLPAQGRPVGARPEAGGHGSASTSGPAARSSTRAGHCSCVDLKPGRYLLDVRVSRTGRQR